MFDGSSTKSKKILISSASVLLAVIAVNVDDPSAIEESDAPMATLFEIVSGRGTDTGVSLTSTRHWLQRLAIACRRARQPGHSLYSSAAR